MANIREYNSPNAPAGIQGDFTKAANSYKETGDAQRFFANQIAGNIAGGLSAIGRGIDAFQADRSKTEINKLQTAFSLQELNNSEGWDAALAGADPNDGTFGQSYLDERYAQLDETVAAASTPEARAYAEKEATRQKIALAKTVHADTSTIAASAAVTNTETAVNAGVAFLKDNPDQLDDKLAHVGDVVQNAIPLNVDPVKRATAIAASTLDARQHYVKAALTSMATKSPDAFMKQWENGDFKKYADAGLIDPNDNYPAIAQAAKNSQTNAAAATEAKQKTEQRANIDKYSAGLVSGTLKPDGTRSVGPEFFKALAPDGELASMPGVTRTDITTLEDWGLAIMNGKTAKTNDPATLSDFNQRMFLPQSDPRHLTEQQIIQAVVDGKLKSGEDGDGIFYKAIATTKPAASGAVPTQAAAYTEVQNNALHVFDAPNFTTDGKYPTPTEAAEEQKYQQWFGPAYLSRLKTPENPNGKTPLELLTPGSPDYLPGQYPGLTPTEKAKLGTFYPQSVRPPVGSVPAPGGGSVIPPANRKPLDSIFNGTPVPKPQASLDSTATGSVQLAAAQTVGSNGTLMEASFVVPDTVAPATVQGAPAKGIPASDATLAPAPKVGTNTRLEANQVLFGPGGIVPGEHFTPHDAVVEADAAHPDVPSGSATPSPNYPPVTADLVGAATGILESEEGYAGNAGWDVNAWRLGFGSDTITKADGTVVRVKKGDTVSRADAERDLARRLPDFIHVATTAIGPAAWAKLPPAAQGALVSLTYNYGWVPASVVAAAQSGDLMKLADAFDKLPDAGHGDPKISAALHRRRNREAAYIRSAATVQSMPKPSDEPPTVYTSA